MLCSSFFLTVLEDKNSFSHIVNIFLYPDDTRDISEVSRRHGVALWEEPHGKGTEFSLLLNRCASVIKY
jgi:hypothetical protein